jgi:hypothetical protein
MTRIVTDDEFQPEEYDATVEFEGWEEEDESGDSGWTVMIRDRFHGHNVKLEARFLPNGDIILATSTHRQAPMRPFVDFRQQKRTGSDKFGEFHLTGGPCTHCGNERTVCVHYRIQPNGQFVDLGEGIKPSDTILQPHGTMVDDTYLGINCGCYGKLHRQVAHIIDRREARKK